MCNGPGRGVRNIYCCVNHAPVPYQSLHGRPKSHLQSPDGATIGA